ncbi:hypothetical protein HDU76_013064 [Blyttiomyces sp. JEL0837]|nr:hypothetical protein HDU76_013064 [Blyttiomyces sp. JEL0837]
MDPHHHRSRPTSSKTPSPSPTPDLLLHVAPPAPSAQLFNLFEEDGTHRVRIANFLSQGEVHFLASHTGNDGPTTTTSVSVHVSQRKTIFHHHHQHQHQHLHPLDHVNGNGLSVTFAGNREEGADSDGYGSPHEEELTAVASVIGAESVISNPTGGTVKGSQDRAGGGGRGNETSDKTKPRPNHRHPPSSTAKRRLGIIEGVFIPAFQNIVGVIVFVRLAWIVGQAGLGQALLIAALSTSLTAITALSMSAIVTNGKINVGGAYYLISRSLGKEIGGSVGMLFYFGNVIGSAMYALGVVEILTIHILPASNLGSPATNSRIYGTALLAMVVLIVLIGAQLVNKASIIFFAAVFIALVSSILGLAASNRPGMIDGVIGFPGDIADNLGPGYGKQDVRGNVDSVTFFDLFGIFFPAVTGVLAGASRSGELRDPQRHIPQGTLSAHGVSTFMYFTIIIFLAFTVEGPLLRTKIPPSGLLLANVAWPSKWVTLIGCFFASLGAALQCLINGQKLLHAMAKDDIAPVLSWFKIVSKRSRFFGILPANEPHRALLISVIFAEAAILVGNLDIISKIVTLFYLTCYVFINSSTAVMGFLKSPNWRPAWKYYHWMLSSLGALMALAFAFMISWIVALIAVLLMTLFYKYIEYRGAQVQFGDGLQALHLRLAQQNLLTLEKSNVGLMDAELEGLLKKHEENIDDGLNRLMMGVGTGAAVKNWRPHILMLVEVLEDEGSERGRMMGWKLKYPRALDFLSQLRKGGGLAVVANVFVGDFINLEQEMIKVKQIETMLKLSIKDHHLNAFAEVSISPEINTGILSTVQTVGVGPLRPNTILLGWPTVPTPSFVKLIRSIINMDKALLLVKGLSEFPSKRFQKTPEHHYGTVDVYWIVHDGGILTLLAHLLTKHAVWRKCRLRIFAIAAPEDNSVQMKRNLKVTLERLRIDAVSDVLEFGDHDLDPFVRERTLRMRERIELLKKLESGGGAGGGNGGGGSSSVAAGGGGNSGVMGSSSTIRDNIGTLADLKAQTKTRLPSTESRIDIGAGSVDDTGSVTLPRLRKASLNSPVAATANAGFPSIVGSLKTGAGGVALLDRMRSFRSFNLGGDRDSSSGGGSGGIDADDIAMDTVSSYNGNGDTTRSNIGSQAFAVDPVNVRVGQGGGGGRDRRQAPNDLWSVHGLERGPSVNPVSPLVRASTFHDGSGNASTAGTSAGSSLIKAKITTSNSAVELSRSGSGSGSGSGSKFVDATRKGSYRNHVAIVEEQDEIEIDIENEGGGIGNGNSGGVISEEVDVDTDRTQTQNELVIEDNTGVVDEKDIAIYNRRMATAVELNNLMKRHSQGAQLIISNLPVPARPSSSHMARKDSRSGGGGDDGAAGGYGNTDDGFAHPFEEGFDEVEYISYLEAMMDGINRIMLIKGTGYEVVTDFY